MYACAEHLVADDSALPPVSREELRRTMELCPLPDEAEMVELAEIRENARSLRHFDGRKLQTYVAILAGKLRHAWEFRVAADAVVRAALRAGPPGEPSE